MINTVKSLIWLRTQMLLSNKNLLVQIAMPYGLALLYKELLSEGPADNLTLLSTCLAMSFAFALGNIVSNIISEEKEKHNLNNMILAGVSSLEYLAGTLFYPVLLGIASILVFPVLMAIDLGEKYQAYLLVSSLTALVVILLNLVITLYSKSQAKTQVNTLPVMLMVSFLPMLSELSGQIKRLTDYSFMGSYTKLFDPTFTGNIFEDPSFLALSVWVIGLILLNIQAFRGLKPSSKSRSTSEKKQAKSRFLRQI